MPLHRENIFRTDDPTETNLTIEQAAALQKGDRIVWKGDDFRHEGDLIEMSIQFRESTSDNPDLASGLNKYMGYVFYLLETGPGEDDVQEFLEWYPMGDDKEKFEEQVDAIGVIYNSEPKGWDK